MTRTDSPGQALTAELRKMYQVGPRTRWNARRTCRILTRDAMIRDIRDAIGNFRGCESERRTAIFDKAHAALCAYAKFIDGYRIDGYLRHTLVDGSPWDWTAFLGKMVDSGCTNMGEFEEWFSALARQTPATV